MKRFFILLYLLVLLTSCGKNLPAIDNLDLELWRKDKDGCNGFRFETREAMETNIEKLKGLSEMDIVNLLGSPDQNELYKRNQKFYTYFLQPSASCSQAVKNPLKLVIRFNAMGLAKEITVE